MGPFKTSGSLSLFPWLSPLAPECHVSCGPCSLEIGAKLPTQLVSSRQPSANETPSAEEHTHGRSRWQDPSEAETGQLASEL